jgi:large subunit ribosomal protein L14e
MIEIGRLCIKIAGRDAGKKCVVVDIVNDNTVLIDGETRRRNCNIKHIEPLKGTIKIKKGASHADIVSEFKKLDVEIKEKKSKKTAERTRKVRKKKVASESEKGLEKSKTSRKVKPEAEEKAKAPKKPAKKKETSPKKE